MHNRLFLLVPLLLFPVLAQSQLMPCTLNPVEDAQNVGVARATFELGKPFEHPVPLPGQVLAALRADTINDQQFRACTSGRRLSEMPAGWFSGTEVSLAENELPGLVVKATSACLRDKHGDGELGGFWVFRQAQSGYQLLLARRSRALQVMATTSNGYPDVCFMSGTYNALSQDIYTFQQGRYELLSSGAVVVDFLPAVSR